MRPTIGWPERVKRGVWPGRTLAGLVFLGLRWQSKLKLAFLWGVGEDAAYLAEQIVARWRPQDGPSVNRRRP